MFKFVIGLSAMAACALPLAAAAQSYHQVNPEDEGSAAWRDYNYRPNADRDDYASRGDDSRGYADDQDAGPPPSAGSYGADSAYEGPEDPAAPPTDGRFTGRVGASWRDDQGRYCSWREVGRRDGDGYDSFKWITVCR
jgi:hypothetical protein